MRTLVCLHGWGGSKESFTELRAALNGSDVFLLTPDLPGFGTEAEPHVAWNTDDFVDWTESYIRKNVTGPFELLGHSHGGRIAIKLALRKSLPIKHLYLCAAAGIRHPRHIKRIIGLTLAKTGALLLRIPLLRPLQPLGKKCLYKLVRVHDYERASPVMRQTLINVSAEDLRQKLSDIDLPVDIFWGMQDGMTPFSDALLMEKAIKGSVLHAYDGIRHGVHRDKAREIANVIKGRMQA